MSDTTENIRAKAQGIKNGIKASSAKERDLAPTIPFGEDYNRLRNYALKVKPDLKDVIPPEVTFNKEVGREITLSRYVEILAYTEQILQFFPPELCMESV